MQRDGLTTLIEFRCVRPDHLTGHGPERVFVYGGAWAYCPAGRGAVNHKLIPTGGVDLKHL